MTFGIQSRVTGSSCTKTGLTNYFRRSRLLMELMCAVRPSSCWRKGENRGGGLVGLLIFAAFGLRHALAGRCGRGKRAGRW